MNRFLQAFILCFALCLTGTSMSFAQTSVFINEIHYDNDGTDAGEAIEIAGPAGTDLTGWSIVLYNGNGGAEYDTENLSGTLVDDGSGFGFASVAISGIQNGAPDGIVLFDGVSVVQFLSYEGDFVAVGGVADGMMSTDIGVSESSSTPAGNSLQLGGTGSVYEDFTWESDAVSTFDAANTNQVFVGAANVFINEIHYDNDGGDVDEAIEIAGTAGTDLSGWSIVLYNGNGGTEYDTENLSGTLVDDGSGFGFLSFPISGIQNGAPDGIVLFDGTEVIQFLSYEGEFTAVGGVADGMTSTDIGVSESSSTPIGNSLQLAGTGLAYADFVWEADAPNTFGAVNTNQVFAEDTNATPVVAITEPADGSSFDEGTLITFSGTATDDEDGDLSANIEWSSNLDGSLGTGASIMATLSIGTHMITASATDSGLDTGSADIAVTVSPIGGTATAVFINEIHYDNDGGDTGEAIEIAGPAGTDLTGWSIVLYNGNGGTEYDSENLSGTLADDGSGFGFLSVAISGIQNGAPDGIVLFDGVSVVQFLSYEGDFVAVGGVADGMMSTDIGVSESSSTPIGNSLQLMGTGTVYEDFTWDTDAPDTFGAVNTNQVFAGGGNVFINEIHYDNDGGDVDEGVEIAGPAGTDLTGWSIVLYNGNGGTEYDSENLSGTLADDGSGFGFLFFPISGMQNGAPDGIVLYNGEEVIQFLSYEGDFVAVGGVADGMMSTDIGVSESSGTPVGNSLQLMGTGFSAGDFIWAADAPNTYGAVNTGQEFGDGAEDIIAEIFEIQGADLTSPFENMEVTSENNVVTALGVNGFFIQTPADRTDGDDATSDGIFVFTDTAPTVSVGDLVTVTGTVIEFFEFTEFSPVTEVLIVGTGDVPAPVVFDETVPSPDQPQGDTAYEQYEGMLVTVANGYVVGPSQSFGTDPEAEAYVVASGIQTFREPGIEFPGIAGLPIWDGNPEIFELDPDKLGLTNELLPIGSTFSATGVLGFEFGGYELWPNELTTSVATLPGAVRAAESTEGTVASLNLFRLFDDVDDGNEEVVDLEEYQRRLTKFSMYVRDVLQSPDILAVQEAEKLGVLEDLATQIQNDDPSVSYDAYLVEGNDVGGIDVGYLVKSSAVQVNNVTQLAADEILTFDGSLLHDRPPLLLEADFLLNGVPTFPIEVLVVHNRSLSGIDGDSGERVRTKRLEQAQSIAQIVQDRQTANSDVRLTVVGDFNAFEFTDGYVDAIGQIRGVFNPDDNLLSGDDLVDPDLTNQVLNLPEEERYSFIFRGSAQVLDHALTTVGLDEFVTDYAYGRGNAGAPLVLLDDETTPLRASDHDGLVLYVQLQPEFSSVAVLAAEKSMFLSTGTDVISGDLLVQGDAGDDGSLLPGYELALGKRVTTPAGFEVKADGLLVLPQAVVGGNVAYNTLENFGTIEGSETTPLALPVFEFPEFKSGVAGDASVIVPKNQEGILDAGAYGHVVVRPGATLKLTGGVYDVASLTVNRLGEVRFEGAGEMRVEGRVDVKQNAMIGPADLSTMEASDFVIYVEGINGNSGGMHDTPAAVTVGNSSNLQVNVYAANGTLSLQDNVSAEGAFLAQHISVGRNGHVTLNSFWSVGEDAALAESERTLDQLSEMLATELPEEYALDQNYPNPFNPVTTIPYSMPEAGHVKLVVYDLLGRHVETLIDAEVNAGFHSISFDARSFPSGAYIYRLETNGFVEVKKMMLIK